MLTKIIHWIIMMEIPKLMDILFPQRVREREAEQARHWALEREEREKQRAMEQTRNEMSIAIDAMHKWDGKYIHMDEIQCRMCRYLLFHASVLNVEAS